MVCFGVSLIVVEDVDALCDLEVDGADAGEQHRLQQHVVFHFDAAVLKLQVDILQHADVFFR